jgi:hypothetical protein
VSATDSTAGLIGALVGRLVWIYTAVVFLLKLTRWIDWSWWSVFAPLFWLNVVALGLWILGHVLQSIGGSRRNSKPYTRPQDHDVSHIEPLDSIKNPRKS